ncbi:MAG: hypothetical protein A3C49_03570 [Candidatus Doudnabacteria bacterium RIFCSPHIGHO2_02_FULL_42_25]|uniref:Pyrroloquinoline quinone-dependent pyranose dehydrogenase beta-propeller domain-containing protein n=1 Tax=Candidatus Doudnabacteria bacterium RIFCSPHIGHO2_01_FULL_41_86 TaxID=1817821 RepID=A0A1F5N8D4_9BACT|nr:MAG: hypothetical protein A2717_04550 [Candidatus Doudnabacteria bacterium RIFCSPHIGHO2_01_FULL_41_86]OGE75883.1 MAG: hypothetical protein A3K07_04145 [Candidatus Doudnabacteria bacterium RIFCSPHIGHO2_01_43_10]OGE86257.1 MAG: hypothetical protein A3E28_03905 [Candidatus Doudnabacteria bacterium RIFCSPHIGHO2_12_FULL_42_22]OGE87105.1 MAG: hypothetical protein A3C49_03570 [Candidatus Doudnabacteria bacterium RIFCSPHIGHO2_02_FULL_42_25]OGE92245.1 MAG: hypothetical protein A2895_04255 [Candidatus
MKRNLTLVLILVAVLVVLVFINERRKQQEDTEEAIQPPVIVGDPSLAGDHTGLGLVLPEHFGIQKFVEDVPGARVMAWDGMGNLWISQTSEDAITKITVQNGNPTKKEKVFSRLKRPHGIAFDPQDGNVLYFAEEDKISQVNIATEPLNPVVIKDGLPTGGRHVTRTIKFGPDDRLYLSVGSSCNVCIEDNEYRAKIFSMKKDGSDFKELARGLRNSVFFTWSYLDGKMWATDMGSDHLGDDLPPDEINVIQQDGNYGWPNCYGKNNHDSDFDKNVYIRNPCMDPYEISSHIDLPAHTAVLGLDFIPEEGWPSSLWYDLIVASHGSSERSEKIGYKLLHVKLDAKGNYEGTEDFISGWLQDDEVLGRPVDVLIQPGGQMYVSDDKSGVIYKVTYNGPQE